MNTAAPIILIVLGAALYVIHRIHMNADDNTETLTVTGGFYINQREWEYMARIYRDKTTGRIHNVDLLETRKLVYNPEGRYDGFELADMTADEECQLTEFIKDRHV